MGHGPASVPFENDHSGIRQAPSHTGASFPRGASLGLSGEKLNGKPERTKAHASSPATTIHFHFAMPKFLTFKDYSSSSFVRGLSHCGAQENRGTKPSAYVIILLLGILPFRLRWHLAPPKHKLGSGPTHFIEGS